MRRRALALVVCLPLVSGADVGTDVGRDAGAGDGADVGGGTRADVGTDVDALVDEADCAPPEPGFLTLDTAPWTLVYVDGNYVGSTPLFKHKLAPGEHTLTLVNEAKGVLTHEDVVIDEGRARKLKLVLLLAEETTSALDATQDIAIAPEDCFIPEDEAAHLSVDSVPWSKVFLDGKPLGSTPLFKHAIAAGDHVVRLVRPDGSAAFSRFHATVGETVKLAVRIDQEPEDRP